MADHGGHDRTHGTTLPEDMTVPMFISDKNAAAGEMNGDISLLEIAPTIASIMGITPDEQWEGRALV